MKTEFELKNSWPFIPPYIEVEGPDEDSVHKTVALLGFKKEDTTAIGVADVYEKYDHNIHDYKELKF